MFDLFMFKGWQGLHCDKECSEGTYGSDCKLKCDCKNGGVCDHVTGQCKCLPGFHGQKCEQSCPAMMYGLGCRQNCSCVRENTQKCDPARGVCQCKREFTGWFDLNL